MAILNFPILYAPDPLKGRPLGGGQIYVGEPDLDPEIPINQKQLNIIQEDGTVVPVPQPFTLSFGGVPTYNGATVRLDVDGNYSFKLLDKHGTQKYYVENVLSGKPVTEDEIINNLALSYVFDTVADYKAFATAFPVGKVIKLLDRGAEFTVISGTGTADEFGVVSSSAVSQSLQIKIDYRMTAEQFGASTSITDNSGAINAALSSLATVVSSVSELRIQASVRIPSGKFCDGLRVYSDGDNFTGSTSPVALVVNETFGNFSNPDSDLGFVNGSIRVSNNTVAFSPKGCMFGGVNKGYFQGNNVTINGSKHSAAFELYKSGRDIYCENNTIDISTGAVTGGGLWFANRTQVDTCENIYINNNIVRQNSIDEILAIFPSVGPMKNVHINNNTLVRGSDGAVNGPIMRIFCADGLTGGTSSGTIDDVSGTGNKCYNRRVGNDTSGFVQIGNFPSDVNDPTNVRLDALTIHGEFAASAVGLRVVLNNPTNSIVVTNPDIVNNAVKATTLGITATDGAKIIGGKVENFSTDVDAYWIEGVNIVDGSIGAVVRSLMMNCTATGQTSSSARVRSRGVGVSQVIKGNHFKPAATKVCLQLDTNTSPSTIENLRLADNNFDGSEGSVTAITKIGSQTISYTQASANDFSSCSTLWTNTLGMLLSRNTYNPTITNPAGSISADPGSEFWNPAGGAGSTFYVKESNTGNTGWVAK